METWQTLGIAVGAAVAFGALATVRRITVHEFEQALLYVRGRLRRILSGGAYWMFRPLQTVTVVDMRSRALSVAGQEVLSSDGVSVKVSLAFRIKIADLAKAIHGAQDFQEALYLESQLVLRSLLSALPVDEIIARRDEIGRQLRERVEPRAAELGLSIETLGIKDIMFPGNLKQIFAQVVEARHAGLAALERARGETATLRNLANAARMIEENPALVTLKTLQAASDGKHTLVFGLSQPILPIPAAPAPGQAGAGPGEGRPAESAPPREEGEPGGRRGRGRKRPS